MARESSAFEIMVHLGRNSELLSLEGGEYGCAKGQIALTLALSRAERENGSQRWA